MNGFVSHTCIVMITFTKRPKAMIIREDFGMFAEKCPFKFYYKNEE